MRSLPEWFRFRLNPVTLVISTKFKDLIKMRIYARLNYLATDETLTRILHQAPEFWVMDAENQPENRIAGLSILRDSLIFA